MAPPSTSWRRNLPLGIAPLLLHSLSLFFAHVNGSGLVNITVDDQLGDPITGLVPAYSPDGAWNVGSPSESCTACHLNPSTLDLTQIHNKTWHDATPLDSSTPTTITVHFTGSAVYVFNIVPNTLPNSTITLVNITFAIDGTDPHTFTHSPDPNSNTILYNQLVYQNTALDDGPHTLIMTAGHYSLILFDYLLYTTQSNDMTSTSATSTSTNAAQSSESSSSTPLATSTRSSSSSTPVGAVVGGVVGGVVLLLGVAIVAFLLGRRRARSKPTQTHGGHGAFLARPDATPCPPPSLDPAMRSLDRGTAHILPYLASAVSGPDARPPLVNGIADAAPSPSAAEWSSNPKRRAELARRLETLQRTRSVLSSQTPSRRSPSELEVSRESGAETAIRELEAEIAQLRGALAALNARLADGHDGYLEPLPEYVE